MGVNGADIDHLVIGPGGVFSLSAKHHSGGNVWVGGNTLMINGQRQPYIRNSQHEAQRASKLLTAACGFLVPVIGMVVPVGANNVTIKTPSADVHVVNRMALSRWLRARPEVLSLEHLEAVYGAARRSTTWQQPPERLVNRALNEWPRHLLTPAVGVRRPRRMSAPRLANGGWALVTHDVRD